MSKGAGPFTLHMSMNVPVPVPPYSAHDFAFAGAAGFAGADGSVGLADRSPDAAADPGGPSLFFASCLLPRAPSAIAAAPKRIVSFFIVSSVGPHPASRAPPPPPRSARSRARPRGGGMTRVDTRDSVRAWAVL